MVKQNLEDIRRRIELVCRHREEITLVAVTKGISLEEIKAAIECGISDIGENRIQEAIPKYNGLQTTYDERRINWHMIGHLQTNKVKEAVRIFDLIQSVDSLRLAEVISKEAGKINKQQDILLEIKTSPEESKFGLRPEDTLAVFQEISRLPNLNIKGLMTIAPFADNPQDSRPYFKMLKELLSQINERRTTDDACLPSASLGFAERRAPRGEPARQGLRILSMGMSNDFEIAIEEGSTMVRLGRAIFEG